MKSVLKESPLLLNLGGDCIVELAFDEDGKPYTKPCSEKSIRAMLVKDLDWVYTSENEQGDLTTQPGAPPQDVAAEVIVNPPPSIPVIDKIVTIPVFSPSGKLLTKYGLHKEERIWHHKDEGLDLAPVPEAPTEAEVKDAIALYDELFHDFAFVRRSDKTHCLAGFLLPFMRQMINGQTPLHSLEAPMPGSGKGLLVNALFLIATGGTPAACTFSLNPEEFRKKLTSVLMEGRDLILLDNIPENKEMDSPDLASVLTSPVWKDRYLGQNKMVTAKNSGAWYMTANNPNLSREIARRTIRCRINPETDKPWLRTNFLHKDLLSWILENRARLVHAALTIIQSWIAAGQPRSKKRLGSFEDWAAKMGGIFEHVGLEGFLENLDEMYAAADSEGEEWRMFFEFILGKDEKTDKLNRNHITPSMVVEECTDEELLMSIMGKGSERSRAVNIGNAFQRIRDRVYAGHRLVVAKDDKKRGRVYALEAVGQ